VRLKLRAIFGGTFDPVHRGHLGAAREVHAALAPDTFHFLPAGRPPHRSGTYAPAEARLRLLELALADSPGLGIDTRELEREGPSFMVDTLASLRAEHPDEALALVLGQDALNGLDRWHDWRRLPELAHLVVMTRPGESAAYGNALAEVLAPRFVADPAALRTATAGAVLRVAVTPRPVSSTLIRDRIDDPEALRALVPEAVAAAIEREGLYRSPARPTGADL
jgi:nicotinate-nucleotide adenylyltransferase